MSFLWLSLLAIAVLFGVVTRVDLRVRAHFDSLRAEQRRIHEANREAAFSVQERLLTGPLPVRTSVERGWRGRRLVLRLDDVVLRLHLYGGAQRFGRVGREPDQERPSPAFLVELTDAPDRGWQAVIGGPRGSETYEGWLLEQRDGPGRGATNRERATTDR